MLVLLRLRRIAGVAAVGLPFAVTLGVVLAAILRPARRTPAGGRER